MGKGVRTAVKNVIEQIQPELIDFSVFDQVDIDHLMIEIDGTKNKSKLGANAILGSRGCARNPRYWFRNQSVVSRARHVRGLQITSCWGPGYQWLQVMGPLGGVSN